MIYELFSDIPSVFRAGKIYYSVIGVQEFLKKKREFDVDDIEFCPMYICNNRCGDFYWYKLLITDQISIDDFVFLRNKKTISQISDAELAKCNTLFIDKRLSDGMTIRNKVLKYIDSLYGNEEIKEDVLSRWGEYDVANFFFHIYSVN